MNRPSRSLFASISVMALLVTPLLADKPAADNTNTTEATTAAIEAQIKASEVQSAAQANHSENSLEARLFKEVHAQNSFTDHDREILTQYAKENGNDSWKNVNQSPNLQKKVPQSEALPSDWQKKLQLGAPIPKDIWDNRRAIPDDLYKTYQHPPGTEDVVIEDNIYRVTQKTHQIIDVINID